MKYYAAYDVISVIMQLLCFMALAPFYEQHLIEAGCDEAGRGCLAGPVCAAAVILPHDFYHPLLNDSKKMSEAHRNLLRPIIEQEAIAFAVSFVDHLEIDRINILRASFKAMHKALDKLSVRPQSLLIDGNRFVPYKKIPHHCMIKGDGRFASIAAASILAKTYRDQKMQQLHRKFPQYSWSQNMGYPTSAHRDAVVQFGLSPYHRKSFACYPKQPELEFK